MDRKHSFDVVVIGGGMTAVDAAVQARLLGALQLYRRDPPPVRRDGEAACRR